MLFTYCKVANIGIKKASLVIVLVPILQFKVLEAKRKSPLFKSRYKGMKLTFELNFWSKTLQEEKNQETCDFLNYFVS